MITEKKRCSKCLESLSLTLFNKDKSTSDGYKTSCKECDRWIRARNRYGITEEQWSFFNSEKASCEICKTDVDLCIDHNHDTGEYRGTLCRACNRGIGMLKDNSILAFRAYEYLKGNKC